MTMEALCRLLELPEEVTGQLLAIHNDPVFQPDIAPLRREDRWTAGLSSLKDQLREDPHGTKILCCMLRCALLAREDYHKMGIPEAVYRDTFRCFTRFVCEHRQSYGRYGFDRSFWTVRQVSCKLFRIGQLEYELTYLENRPAVSLHIPSDARLEQPLLRRSWEDARALIGRLWPEYRDAPMFCRSWLLSPELKQLLPPGSRILAFQQAFAITPLENSTGGYVLWVFKNPTLSPEDYPENTSLQKTLKRHVLAGGTVHDGMGFLASDPFLP